MIETLAEDETRLIENCQHAARTITEKAEIEAWAEMLRQCGPGYDERRFPLGRLREFWNKRKTPAGTVERTR